MTKLDEKIQYFKDWQDKIVKLDSEIGPKLRELQAEYDKKANELSLELNAETSKYKAEFKAAFGLCDGEKANTLNLIETIKAVNQLI